MTTTQKAIKTEEALKSVENVFYVNGSTVPAGIHLTVKDGASPEGMKSAFELLKNSGVSDLIKDVVAYGDMELPKDVCAGSIEFSRVKVCKDYKVYVPTRGLLRI